MMKLSVSIFLLFASGLCLNAQFISNHEFSWSQVNDCLPKGICTEIYYRSEIDPTINQYNSQEFLNLMKNAVSCMKLDSNLTGTLKLKLLFLQNQPLCLNEVGSLKIEISEKALTALSNRFKVIDQLTYGKMNNEKINSRGYLYLNIKNGKLESMRNVNFKLKE